MSDSRMDSSSGDRFVGPRVLKRLQGIAAELAAADGRLREALLVAVESLDLDPAEGWVVDDQTGRVYRGGAAAASSSTSATSAEGATS